MHRKNTERYRKVVRLRAVAITVAFAMLFSLLPVYVLAVGAEYLCGHTHDEACNYSISGEGTPCNHICGILSFTDYIPGTAISTYNAQEDDTYESICKALPKVLNGQTACATGDVGIPVSWSCEDFAEEAGTYIFRAELKNKKCAYTVTDDELTGDLDESELPFIAVTVPEPEASVYTLTHATHPVTVSGTDKALDGARLLVKKVELSEVQELLGDDAGSALFAYDIKIMTGGELDEETGEYIGEVEYQPTAENPVKVLITPSEPIAAPVEVIHIAEDEETGEVTASPITDVNTTLSNEAAEKSGAVEFHTDGFSVFVVTIGSNVPRVTFSYDNESFEVKYCDTIDGVYVALNDNISVAVGTDLYFTVTGSAVAGVYCDGSTTAMTADTNGIYAINSISNNTLITIGNIITLDVTYGSIVIGADDGYGVRKYTYSDSGGARSGDHVSSNIYTIIGETGNSTTGGYNVSLKGDGDFNVILSDVTIYTGSPGPIYVGVGDCAPVSTAGVTGNGIINITLVGENYLTNISANPASSYAALEKNDTDSTLVIGGVGSLTAIGGADSTGIGGSNDPYGNGVARNITINSGTIVATTHDSAGAGIGGCDNDPAYNIRIYGGHITATGSVNGAGIGGSGSSSYIACSGEVYIYGGTIIARSNGSGAGIGGGGSGNTIDSVGGDGQVYIYGGNIIADYIGGGGGGESGGNATLDISGGKITIDNDGGIGGGSAENGLGGNVTATITGGTIVTPRISGGYSGLTGTYKDAIISIAAASVNIGDTSNITSVTGPNPETQMEVVVYSQELNIGSLTGYTGESSNIQIQSAVLTDGQTYPLTDVYSDNNGNIYFWLPLGYDIYSLTIDGEEYLAEGAQVQTATITHDSSTVGSVLGAVLNYGTPEEIQWQISDNGTDNWSNIAGETSEYYTVVSGDLNKYIRVIITPNVGTAVTSGSLLITPTPHAGIVFTTLDVDSVLTAQLLNATATTYQWQCYDSVSDTWVDIASATAEMYTIGNDDLGNRIRVVIGDGSEYYTSNFIVPDNPTFIVIIPESVEATTLTSSFTISGQRNHFAQSHFLAVSCSGDFEMKLPGAPSDTLSYTLYTDSQRQNAVVNNGTVAEFSGNGNSVVPVYYTIMDSAIYSGNYTDTLTFTVIFDNGT